MKCIAGGGLPTALLRHLIYQHEIPFSRVPYHVTASKYGAILLRHLYLHDHVSSTLGTDKS